MWRGRVNERVRTGETDTRQRQRGGEQTDRQRERERDNSGERERERQTDRQTDRQKETIIATNEVMKRFQKQLVSIPQEPKSRRTV